jgi:hypothetical protein
MGYANIPAFNVEIRHRLSRLQGNAEFMSNTGSSDGIQIDLYSQVR